MPFPTGHAAVDEVLRGFEARIREILGDQVAGIYLYGSLALGDFDPQRSDIDFIVVTDGVPTDDQASALHEMHEQFNTSDSPWSGRIEAAYLSRDALNVHMPGDDTYPQLETGFELRWMPLEMGWPFMRHTLREHGVPVAGPPPTTLIRPVPREDMRAAAATIIDTWRGLAAGDTMWINWVSSLDGQCFVVLTLCRTLYTLETGQVASKPAAARWASKQLGEPWASLIAFALAHQHVDGTADENTVAATLALVRLTSERIAASDDTGL